MPPDLLTIDEAAAVASVHANTVRRALAEGRLTPDPASAAAGRYLFGREAVEHWAGSRRPRPLKYAPRDRS